MQPEVKNVHETNETKKCQITLDTSTYAWNQEMYKLDQKNANICIKTDPSFDSQWLCSSDLPQSGEFMFSINVIKVTKVSIGSPMSIGIMESKWKGEKWEDTIKHCCYLFPFLQQIRTPNQEQSMEDSIPCLCQPLGQLPCVIECYVNRQQSMVRWHFNGKEQAKCRIPRSWNLQKRAICAVVTIWNWADSIQFM